MGIRTLALAAGLACSMSAFAQSSTVVTYQGELKVGGAAAEGAFDLRFRLMDAATGGTQVGATLCADNVPVAAGVFTVSLDFGDQYSGGDARFLEIEVRPDTGLACGDGTGFEPLSPRQHLTITPFAAYAINARNANNAQSADFASNAGSLGGQAPSFYRNASNLNAGALADARLSSNIPRLNAASTFTGAVTLSNPLNSISGAGAGLTSLNAANLSSGVLPDGRLTGAYSGQVSFTNINNSFAGDGGGLTGLNAANLTLGTLPPSALFGNYPAALTLDNPNNVIVGMHSGNGSGITNLSASNVSFGTLSPARGGTGSSITSATAGHVLKWNGAAFIAQPDDNTTYTAGAGLALVGTTFSIASGGVLSGMLAPNAVASSSIADGTIAASDIGSGAVGSDELAFDAASLGRVSGGVLDSTGGNIGLGIPAGADRLRVNGAMRVDSTLSVGGTSTLSGNVGIGGAPTSARLNVIGSANVTGTVTATGFVAPSTARVLNLSAADFSGTAEHVFDDGGINPTNQVLLSCGSTTRATQGYAPVHLPSGAVVTSMTAYVIDSSITTNVDVFLIRRTPDNVDTGGTMASVSSSGSDNDIRTFTDTTISGATINNDTSMYYVRVHFPLGASLYIDNPNLVAVRINYTSTAP